MNMVSSLIYDTKVISNIWITNEQRTIITPFTCFPCGFLMNPPTVGRRTKHKTLRVLMGRERWVTFFCEVLFGASCPIVIEFDLWMCVCEKLFSASREQRTSKT